ncbi:MAG: hypothetical protein KAG82_08340 [Alcanivoracaceae bacterium]|jgi:hypothetical protein|nr:hypothetical protein [Alcanivoracaceae bacterium]
MACSGPNLASTDISLLLFAALALAEAISSIKPARAVNIFVIGYGSLKFSSRPEWIRPALGQ